MLANRVAGHRPVTIIAYSMGARVVFDALEMLAHDRASAAGTHNRGSNAGLVFDVLLLGAPLPTSIRFEFLDFLF